jgi:hypothetical protein
LNISVATPRKEKSFLNFVESHLESEYDGSLNMVDANTAVSKLKKIGDRFGLGDAAV